MKKSNILLCLLAVGMMVAMSTSVEAQLFRRNCGCQNRAPIFSRLAPRMRFAQPACNVQPTCNAQPVMTTVSNNCGCNGMMVNNGMIMNGNLNGGTSVLSPGNTQEIIDSNGVRRKIKIGGIIDETCQTTYLNCKQQCEASCTENMAACLAHCECNRDKCDPSIEANCNAPRPACLPVQPNPNPVTNPIGGGPN